MNNFVMHLPLAVLIAIRWLHKRNKKAEGSTGYLELDFHVTQILKALPVPQTRVETRVTCWVITMLYHIRMEAWKRQMTMIRDVSGKLIIL